MYTEIVLDKPRKLRFDITAFRSLEEAMDGKPIGLIVTQLSQLSITALCVALWAGLRHEDRNLTQQAVVRMVEARIEAGGDVLELTKQLNEAISESAVFRSLTGTALVAEGNAAPEPVATESH